jgi:hypothetical protein
MPHNGFRVSAVNCEEILKLNIMEIKIIKCSKESYWYRGKIGKTFEIEEPHHKWGYRVVGNGLMTGVVCFSDAEVLNISGTRSAEKD